MKTYEIRYIKPYTKGATAQLIKTTKSIVTAKNHAINVIKNLGVENPTPFILSIREI